MYDLFVEGVVQQFWMCECILPGEHVKFLENGVVPVPVEPSWLPYLGHPLNLVWNANGYLNRLRSKHSGGIFSLNLLGTRHHILHTPGLTHTFFAQDEKANVNDVAEHIGVVMFGFPKDEGKKFQEAAGELHALGKYLVNEEFSGVMVERTTRRAEENLAHFVTGYEDLAEQKPRERRSRVKKTTNNQGHAVVEAGLFTLQWKGEGMEWILTHLAHNVEWQRRVREEVEAVANKYCHDTELPLADRPSKVPFDAWDNEFPMIYLCLKETMRLGMPGTAFRKNISNQSILIPGTEQVIPPDTYVAMHVFDTRLNADFYDEPMKWDRARYQPDRAEDKRPIYSRMGWGHGRHPCLGVRFARLEINMIIAFWFGYFAEFEHLDAAGNKASKAPASNNNQVGTHRPPSKVYLKCSPF
ncbi:hypothetical protein AC579_10012 [Pseudocercospora musae]|uniref:Cytochrome P450 n=1 Tax=Pseudocercospora musae TaxID=113226 RepID=A0A139I907_9PEZI|nr:hypothetical protein AC579_10012 [Pseudocercospora musae]